MDKKNRDLNYSIYPSDKNIHPKSFFSNICPERSLIIFSIDNGGFLGDLYIEDL